MACRIYRIRRYSKYCYGCSKYATRDKKIDYIKRLITERDGYLQDKDMVIDFVRNTIGRIIGVKFMPGLEASLISLEVEFNRLKTKFKKEKIIWIFITLLILQLLI